MIDVLYDRQREQRDRAEAQLLGSAMMIPKLLPQIVAAASPDRFERPAHRIVAEAVWACWEHDGTADVDRVTDRIISSGRWDEVGNEGLVDLAKLAEPTLEPLRMLGLLDGRRKVWRLCADAMRDVADPTSDPDDVAARLLGALHTSDSGDQAGPIDTETLVAMPAPAWLVEGIVPQGLSMMFGSPKSGKSYLAVSLAWAVAAGAPWFGLPTTQAKTLYLVGEGLGDIRLRAEALTLSEPSRPGQNLQWWPTSLRLSDPADQARLRLAVAKTEARLVVVDTWQRFAGLRDENDAGQTTSALAVLEDLAQEGVSVVVVHHRSKGHEPSARGSSALMASVEAAMLVERDDEQKLARLSSHAARRGQGFAPLTFGWVRSGPDFVLQRHAGW